LWFYIYDEDIMAARVNSPSIKSKENVPPGCSSMQFEIYHHPEEIINREALIENTIQGIRKMNLCHEDDILFVDYRLLPYGNVLFLHKRHISNNMGLILSVVLGNGITCGVIRVI
jgi:protoporphyrinogen oxidase